MSEDRLSVVFAALADPTRRAILARLVESDATVSELAEPFSISLPAVSRHLKVLENAGLISRTRTAQWRSSSLRAEPLRAATIWMEPYRQFWDENFNRLEAHLATAIDKRTGADKRTGIERQTKKPTKGSHRE